MTANVSKTLTFCMIKIVTAVETFYENVVLKNSSCFCNLTAPMVTDNGMFYYYVYLMLIHSPVILGITT